MIEPGVVMERNRSNKKKEKQKQIESRHEIAIMGYYDFSQILLNF